MSAEGRPHGAVSPHLKQSLVVGLQSFTRTSGQAELEAEDPHDFRNKPLYLLAKSPSANSLSFGPDRPKFGL